MIKLSNGEVEDERTVGQEYKSTGRQEDKRTRGQEDNMAKFWCEKGLHEYQLGEGANVEGHDEGDIVRRDCGKEEEGEPDVASTQKEQ